MRPIFVYGGFMSLIVTKTEICKAALNRIGNNYADKVVDIDNPKDETEKRARSGTI